MQLRFEQEVRTTLSMSEVPKLDKQRPHEPDLSKFGARGLRQTNLVHLHFVATKPVDSLLLVLLLRQVLGGSRSRKNGRRVGHVGNSCRGLEATRRYPRSILAYSIDKSRYYQSVRVSNACWSDLVRSLGEEEQVSRRERGANSAPKVQALVAERGRDEFPPTEPTEPNSSSPPSLLHTIRGTRHQGHATMTGTSLVNRYQHRYKTNCPRSTEIHSPINITYH
jgi:hypothetical protein